MRDLYLPREWSSLRRQRHTRGRQSIPAGSGGDSHRTRLAKTALRLDALCWRVLNIGIAVAYLDFQSLGSHSHGEVLNRRFNEVNEFKNKMEDELRSETGG
jgi:hypothetical protein